MKLDDILIFQQNLKEQEYEDKLSKYFSLHYDILHSYIHDFNYRIGEIYFDKEEKLYIVITHQVHDQVFYINLQYDAKGKLLYPFLSGNLKELELDNGYERIGSYDEFMKDERKRIKIGLELEQKAYQRRLKIIEEELKKF